MQLQIFAAQLNRELILHVQFLAWEQGNSKFDQQNVMLFIVVLQCILIGIESLILVFAWFWI